MPHSSQKFPSQSVGNGKSLEAVTVTVLYKLYLSDN